MCSSLELKSVIESDDGKLLKALGGVAIEGKLIGINPFTFK